MVDSVSVRLKNASVSKKCFFKLNIRRQWNAGTACVSECAQKTLAHRGLRVGPSKVGLSLPERVPMWKAFGCGKVVARYRCILRSAANNLGGILQKMGVVNPLCLEEQLGLVPCSAPYTLGYACAFYTPPTSPRPKLVQRQSDLVPKVDMCGQRGGGRPLKDKLYAQPI